MQNDPGENGRKQALAYLEKTKKRYRKDRSSQSIDSFGEIFDLVRFNYILKLEEQFAGLEEQFSKPTKGRFRKPEQISKYEDLIHSWHFNSNDVALYYELLSHSAKKKQAFLHFTGALFALAILAGIAWLIKQNILLQTKWSEYTWPNILQVWFLLILALFVFLSLLRNTIKTIH